ncbi:putative mitochondrial protein [Andalucia godoyi]|uniref:Putative mitochondrial protein n=1 Tax=Andalucia godoyi TaxID=505711 RepID=A0A8K0AIP1_ANDGO|nr:putative mitochondrial protein [Andalucia godoyi]|eukprot:ANDGO_04077.mRNA.1 putative mitochondrial protein
MPFSWIERRKLLAHYQNTVLGLPSRTRALISWVLEYTQPPHSALLTDDDRERLSLIALLEIKASCRNAEFPALPPLEIVVAGLIPAAPEQISLPKIGVSQAGPGSAVSPNSVSPMLARSENSLSPSSTNGMTASAVSPMGGTSASNAPVAKSVLERQQEFLRNKEANQVKQRELLDARESHELTFAPQSFTKDYRTVMPLSARQKSSPGMVESGAGTSVPSSSLSPKPPSAATSPAAGSAAGVSNSLLASFSPSGATTSRERRFKGSPTASSATSGRSSPTEPERPALESAEKTDKSKKEKKAKPKKTYAFCKEFETSTQFSAEDIEDIYHRWMTALEGSVPDVKSAPKATWDIPKASKEQFYEILNSVFGIHDSFAQQRFFMAFDRFNRASIKGQIDFHGFVHRLSDITKASPEQAARPIFYIFDVQETEMLQRQEVYKVLLSLSKDYKLEDVLFAVQQTYKKFDAANSGGISFGTFSSLLQGDDILLRQIQICLSFTPSAEKFKQMQLELERKKKDVYHQIREKEARALKEFDDGKA